MVEAAMDADAAMDALEDQVQDFANERRHRPRSPMSPDEWEREFRAWQERNPLRGYHAANERAAQEFYEVCRD